MTKFSKVVKYIVLIIFISVNASAFNPPNFKNEFYILKDSFKIYYQGTYKTLNDKILISYKSDGIINGKRVSNPPEKLFLYDFDGNLIGVNSFNAPYYFSINNSFLNDNRIELETSLALNVRETKFARITLNHDLSLFKTVEMDSVIYKKYSAMNNPFMYKDSLYFPCSIAGYTEQNYKYKYYKVIVTDKDYYLKRIFELDTMNFSKKMEKLMISSMTPYCKFDNGHFGVSFFEYDSTFKFYYNVLYEYDFEGKYYSHKESELTFNNEVCRYEILNSKNLYDGSRIVVVNVYYQKQKIKSLMKISNNGDVLWCKPIIEDYKTGILFLETIFNDEYIIAAGRSLPNGFSGEIYPSYLAIFDKEGNKLESYSWHRNSTLDCSVFGVTEGPDKHIMVISKNGTDSLIVSEMIPQFVGVKEKVMKTTPTVNPNPTSDKFTISNIPNSAVSYEIFDIFGERVLSTPSSLRDATPKEGNWEIDVSKLSPGIYFIKIGTQPPLKFVKI